MKALDATELRQVLTERGVLLESLLESVLPD